MTITPTDQDELFFRQQWLLVAVQAKVNLPNLIYLF